MVPWKISGTLSSPSGSDAPTGPPRSIDGVDVYTFRGHKIAEYRTYYDTSRFRVPEGS